jgi:dienelactone hydrolase
MAVGSAWAEVANKSELPARVELHPIPTLWISDQQFLIGDDKGRQVTVAGELRLPQRQGKVPAVVLVHGSGGIGANVPFWVREFNSMGVATFVIDGMTGRSLQGVGTNQAILGRLNLIIDAYRALEILAKHPRVDTNRIALMGFSRGGQATLYASVRRFQKMWNKSGVEFAAYIPFYPDCATTYQDDGDVGDRPIRIFHGTPDNYNPVATCKAYVQRLKQSGRDVELTEYPNAPHGFDNPLGSLTATLSPQSQSVRNCKIVEAPVGTLINAVSKEPFTYKDGCVALGPHVGHDPEATRQAKQAVTALVRTVFKLN